MGLWDKLMGEFIDVIQWIDDSNDTLVYRFERHGNEIKFGAKLTVREGQVAILVNEGQLADTFEPGMYELKTNNLPILSTLQGWKYGFESPFKAEVYFFSTRRFTDLKWGTQNPVMLRDPEFGPIRLRAFGNYTIRIKDTPTFLREIVGTDGRFTTDEITNQLRNMVVSRFANILGQAKIPALDLAGNYDQLGQFLLQRISPEFETVGLELTNLLVENISLPKEVEAVLDKRTSMGIVGNLDQYTQFQAAEALRDAAANPGGGSEALNMGLGLAMAQRMSNALGRSAQQPTAPAPAPQPAPQAAPPPLAPPPLPIANPYYVAVNNQQAGPFPMDELQQKAQTGQLTRETLVWTQGMVKWTPAGEIAELAALFTHLPPPLPRG
ncbi:MAG: SPFH domain-containing protein [Candidatus Competibacteraceae bacterium]|nr:SPFH domain-containing protein [Candidatus Competibacteraceae bacterium]MCP5127721.1 SPFH domain-containing protein [Gammaproteobacteria bacterium]HRX70871.1 SPFH domain-containing protein [Candidatus Competibacteraceae bacterium]